ncbi:MAG: hypothetical protein NC916_00195 [Candidatus Omnitrophica bacterium]|nr:hypothetical protein [Candidatus Omnitrophota bacterium]
MLAIVLIMVGILLRFVPHIPNFTPVAAIALFGAAYLNKKYALIVPLALMIISDIFIGMHNTVLFTWGGFALIAILGMRLKKQKNTKAILFSSLASSLLFYAVSNFGVWTMGWYPHNLKGLIDCYILAIPFLRDFTLATVIYSFAFFGAYELVARFVRNSKYSHVLLTN